MQNGKTVSYTYSLGQAVKTTVERTDELPAVESSTYDVFGRLSTVTSNDGSVQSYTYDNNSRMN